MRKTFTLFGIMGIMTLIIAAIILVLNLPSAFAQTEKSTSQDSKMMAKQGMAAFFDKHQGKDTIEAAIKRGEKLFNDLGCAGCHPRGGTIGGTAVTSTGMKMPVPIPKLTGAAIHFPRVATPKGIIVNLGEMNDL
jgi:hypothetical protein